MTVTFTFKPAADGHTAVLSGGATIRRLDFGVGQGEWQDTKWVGNDVRIGFELVLGPGPAQAGNQKPQDRPSRAMLKHGVRLRLQFASTDQQHGRGEAIEMSFHSTTLDRRLALAVALALALAGLRKEEGGAGRRDAAARARCRRAGTTLEGQVDIVAWPGYIERGETDKDYDWVTPFETDTGCKVNVKTAGTSDEMVSLMTQGGYDLVTASGDASLRLIRGGTVQPIDLARVPSYANVDERLKEAPWHFVDGKHYGTPYQWGPNVLMYNTKVFKTRARPPGRSCSRSRSCRTARATRAACRPTTVRSTSPTPRCT